MNRGKLLSITILTNYKNKNYLVFKCIGRKDNTYFGGLNVLQDLEGDKKRKIHTLLLENSSCIFGVNS